MTDHGHVPMPSEVLNITETCACGCWRWNPNVYLPFAKMGHVLDWQTPGAPEGGTG